MGPWNAIWALALAGGGLRNASFALAGGELCNAILGFCCGLLPTIWALAGNVLGNASCVVAWPITWQPENGQQN